MMTETELRQQGLDWNVVQRAFIWNELSKDFIRELVQYDTTYKTQLQYHLLCAFHGYATYPSFFYKNMYIYIQNKLAEEKQLEYYLDKVRQMYYDQHEQEMNASRSVYRFVDGTGRVLDSWIM